MLCHRSSRRRTLQRRLARRRAGGVKSCADSKQIRSCKALRQQTCPPDKSRTENDASTIKLAFRYHGTQQYSINALTDSSGTIKERYAYDAYGNLTIFDGSGTARTATAEGNRYGFTGREWDEELGLYHYRARMYDPLSGRFCSRDPIGFTQEVFGLYTAAFAYKFALDPGGNDWVAPWDENAIWWWPFSGLNPNEQVQVAGGPVNTDSCGGPDGWKDAVDTFDCYACCVKSNTLGNTAVGAGSAAAGTIARPVVPLPWPWGNLKPGKNPWKKAGTFNPWRQWLTKKAKWRGMRMGAGNFPKLHKFVTRAGACGQYVVIAVGFHDIATMTGWCTYQCSKEPGDRDNTPHMGLLH
ncbi:RHS repeat-associated core domain-containing protein [Stieleria sp. ICT_E10.1]|uniref:RHS repeat domain-containing protein n=1 Tax=Stieleria sedimenti TaxID=2976331 RepID=UPI00217F94AD|nr:RHS repeat-associated core domain-containing protein [Stieleria sedimenti]MCS7471596.1 RHS repeat-associated core domain-containing protein [Stieleria sedimenti]